MEGKKLVRKEPRSTGVRLISSKWRDMSVSVRARGRPGSEDGVLLEACRQLIELTVQIANSILCATNLHLPESEHASGRCVPFRFIYHRAGAGVHLLLRGTEISRGS